MLKIECWEIFIPNNSSHTSSCKDFTIRNIVKIQGKYNVNCLQIQGNVEWWESSFLTSWIRPLLYLYSFMQSKLNYKYGYIKQEIQHHIHTNLIQSKDHNPDDDFEQFASDITWFHSPNSKIFLPRVLNSKYVQTIREIQSKLFTNPRECWGLNASKVLSGKLL